MSELTPAHLEAVAVDISRRMRAIAEPDSRFHLDFSQFIPGFPGSAEAARKLMAESLRRHAHWIFATPDNGLLTLRQLLLESGKDLVVPSYGLHRGFMLIEARRIPKHHAVFASWLDGLEYYGRPASLKELRARGPFDLMLTGASAVTSDGLRFGMGAHYLDVEWGVFAEVGMVTQETSIAAVVHDDQVAEGRASLFGPHVRVNHIVTPTRWLVCPPSRRPAGLDWALVSADLAASPPLCELRS